MSYTYLLESGEESSAECYSDIPAFVPSKSSLSVEKYSCNASATESCPDSQSGTTCGLSTGDRGAEKSIASAEASPCQDISAAGKGAGIDGARSGLWSEFARIIGEIRPRYAFVENSPMLTVRGLGRVLGDLSEIGYDARWIVMGADDVGAPHRRKRIWILAHTDAPCERREKPQGSTSPKIQVWSEGAFRALLGSEKLQYAVHSEDERMADGIPDFVDRFRAIGNGQVPLVAATAFNFLKREFE